MNLIYFKTTAASLTAFILYTTVSAADKKLTLEELFEKLEHAREGSQGVKWNY